ncbi:TetR/AcrR family transcriptional regulator [Sphingosinicella sp. CPCC 101087]|uniref:TetR/AcrR family transcriptional regulator n=1 Tax=Sphingosinicella sp. CPCC 101087 TaxID=2497754 RepID=UPI00101E1928|nr:TetR/AcrR family transcriptional regulator [Sphingosinicella sp. CPCC 101087]
MDNDLNSVKTKRAGRGYHHGALRQALIEAAEAVIAERGVDGFSLRETARRAGVSPAAPAHHFGDARGLLTALATEAFRRFGDSLAAADVGETRTERLRSQGMAYVRFALAERAKFDLMWRYGLVDGDDPDLREAGRRAFAVLDEAARGRSERKTDSLDPAVAPSIASWSMVHGFARLALDGAFGTAPGDAERAADQLLPLVLRHLDV